jgi:transcriptional regulator with XRE-family HTH domain
MAGGLGSRLIARRSELDIDQKEAAMMCGVSQKTFHTWEHGGGVKDAYLPHIARFLGVDVGEVALLRVGVDPEEFVAQRLDGAAARVDDVARILKLLRPDPPADSE